MQDAAHFGWSEVDRGSIFVPAEKAVAVAMALDASGELAHQGRGGGSGNGRGRHRVDAIVGFWC
jgi:hypothetical protein